LVPDRLCGRGTKNRPPQHETHIKMCCRLADRARGGQRATGRYHCEGERNEDDHTQARRQTV